MSITRTPAIDRRNSCGSAIACAIVGQQSAVISTRNAVRISMASRTAIKLGREQK